MLAGSEFMRGFRTLFLRNSNSFHRASSEKLSVPSTAIIYIFCQYKGIRAWRDDFAPRRAFSNAESLLNTSNMVPSRLYTQTEVGPEEMLMV